MQLQRGFGVMLALALAACGGGEERVRRRDCEAVLAHLVVLEKGESDQPMCKYHPDCDGERADRFARSCTKVLTRDQADCYLVATTLDEADDCLRRDMFDDSLRTGRRAGSKASGKGGDDPWFGGGGGSPLSQLRRMRDDACACKDATCANEVQQRFTDWAAGPGSTLSGTAKPDEEVMELAMEASECMVKAMSMTSYDAGTGSTGMAACDEYVTLVDRLQLCDAYPYSSRVAAKDALEAMRASWSSYMSDYLKESTNDSCKMLVDSTRQTMQQMGCW
jgi:hypothetical protein